MAKIDKLEAVKHFCNLAIERSEKFGQESGADVESEIMAYKNVIGFIETLKSNPAETYYERSTMPKYKFVLEPFVPVSGKFQDTWNKCDDKDCIAHQNFFYHYHDSDGTLHLFVDRVRIKDVKSLVFDVPVILHSEYTLEYCTVWVDKEWVKENIKEVALG